MSRNLRPFAALPSRLGGFGALGAAALLVAATAFAASRRDRPPLLSLSGSVQGTYTSTVSNADAAKDVEFSGAGSVKPLNVVQFTGSVVSPAFVHNGKTIGDMTLTGGDGSITLHLTGPLAQEGTTPTMQLTFRITGGTGSYEGAKGGGGVTIRLQALPKNAPKTPPPPPAGKTPQTPPAAPPAVQGPSAAFQLRFTP